MENGKKTRALGGRYWGAALFALAAALFAACQGGSLSTPVDVTLADFEISGLEQVYTGKPASVSVKAKTGKTTGAVTIYYDGERDAPAARGSYTVTFDIASGPGFNAATGLIAGKLNIINPYMTATTGGGEVYIYLKGSGEAVVNWGDGTVTGPKTFEGEDNEFFHDYGGAQGSWNIRVEALDTIVDLECVEDNFTSLDIGNNPALQYLDCDINSLTNLDTSNNPALLYLFCSDNGLSALDFSGNPLLKEVQCRGAGLNKDGIEAMFRSLPDRSGSPEDPGHITCYHNDGFEDVDKTIALNLNWIVEEEPNS